MCVPAYRLRLSEDEGVSPSFSAVGVPAALVLEVLGVCSILGFAILLRKGRMNDGFFGSHKAWITRMRTRRAIVVNV